MDDNFNRPMLSCQPCSENLPLVLSSEDVVPPIQVPASMAQYLRNYQRDGVRFLYCKFTAGEGGILADDMGLGKTIQAIAFIAAILKMKGTAEDKLRHCSRYIREDIAPGIKVPSVNPVLIVCPASLSDNWYDELQTWGHFKVFKLSTTNRLELINRAKRKECDVIIVTFETARSSIDFLNNVNWSLVIVDEVHRIKDTNSQVSKALCSLKCKLRYGLTGTPFQNNMTELWCLLNWCNPESLGDLASFNNGIARQMEHGQRRSATKGNVVEKNLAQIKLNSLRRRFMFRRTKDILSKHLPSKTDKIVFCKLTPVQQNIYRMIVQSSDVQKLIGNLNQGSCSKNANISKKKTGLLFTYLHLLQKTANHVGLLASGLMCGASEIAQKVCNDALKECAGLQNVPQNRWLEALSDVNMSGKMQVLSKLLPAFLAKGDKILLFSYSTKVLDLVQKHVVKMRYKYYRLDGTTPADTRFGLVGKFNTTPDPAIFLLSTKAGGIGLNITGANVVIIFDPNWNPAYDLQAQDRAYRLGQERDVRVYRFLSTSTIEEFVYLRQVYKQQLASLVANKNVPRLFNSVSGDSRYYGELFGIRNLFSFRESERSLTEEIIEKQKNLELAVRLKLEAPLRDWRTGAYLSKCGIDGNSKCDDENMTCGTSNKSGLTQLCENVFERNCEDQELDESGDLNVVERHQKEDESGDSHVVEDYNSSGVKEEVQEEEDYTILMKEEILEDVDIETLEDVDVETVEDFGELEGTMNRNGSINAILEKSGAVKNVMEHSKVIAPSTIEDFVSDCAIRDVFQRGVGSHLPAFDCSVGTQDEELTQGTKRPVSSPNLCRLKFNKMAKDEFLTPFEFATKVTSMSYREKANLLKNHQKRKQEAASFEDTFCTKPFRSRAKPNKGTNLPTIEFVDCGQAPDINLDVANNVLGNARATDILNCGEEVQDNSSKMSNWSNTKTVLLETGNGVIAVDVESTQSSTSDQSEPSSSFEKDVSIFNPNISKKALALMEELVCNKNKKAKKSSKKKNTSLKSSKDFVPAHSVKDPQGNVNEVHNEIQNDSTITESSHLDMNSIEKSCSVSAVSLIDSLFFSNRTRKPGPKKRLYDSSGIGVGASTSGINKVADQRDLDSYKCNSLSGQPLVEEGNINSSPEPQFKKKLNSTTSRNLHEEETFNAPHYNSKDDVYRQLIESGKLKLI